MGDILGEFFSNLSGHPGSKMKEQRRVTKEGKRGRKKYNKGNKERRKINGNKEEK
jgi:hypothetical protein